MGAVLVGAESGLDNLALRINIDSPGAAVLLAI